MEMDSVNTLSFDRWAVLKRFFFVFLSLAVVVVGITSALYRADVRAQLAVLGSREEQGTKHQRTMITDELRHMVFELMYLSEESELQSLFDKDIARSRSVVAGEYASYIRRKANYDQIRFIDSAGMEVVRVNRDGGDPVITPEAGLRSKADRD